MGTVRRMPTAFFPLNSTCFPRVCEIHTLGKVCFEDRNSENIRHNFHHYGRAGKGQKEKQAEEERQPAKQG